MCTAFKVYRGNENLHTNVALGREEPPDISPVKPLCMGQALECRSEHHRQSLVTVLFNWVDHRFFSGVEDKNVS